MQVRLSSGCNATVGFLLGGEGSCFYTKIIVAEACFEACSVRATDKRTRASKTPKQIQEEFGLFSFERGQFARYSMDGESCEAVVVGLSSFEVDKKTEDHEHHLFLYDVGERESFVALMREWRPVAGRKCAAKDVREQVVHVVACVRACMYVRLCSNCFCAQAFESHAELQECINDYGALTNMACKRLPPSLKKKCVINKLKVAENQGLFYF